MHITKIRGPFLIVAPLSLIGQWQSEAKSWAPDLNVVLYHGSADARDFLIKQDFFYTDQFVKKTAAVKLRKQHVTKFHILITTYEVVMKDIDVFTKIKWKALIVDEAHRLKNSNSKLFEELSSIPRGHCVLLTGTPLANATEELWALLNFAEPGAFASKEDFLEKFGQLTDAEQVSELHSVLKPYLLRRVKEDVEKSLPPKEETILEVTLTPIQKKFYKAIYERNTVYLFKGAKPSNSPSLMNVMMELRKCCNHPFLIRGAEDRILNEATEQAKQSNLEGDVNHLQIFGDQLVKSSGKFVLISKVRLFKDVFASFLFVYVFVWVINVCVCVISPIFFIF
jgi:SNF2 family DNA or RNA helicase